MKIPVRVPDVVRSLVGSGVMAAVAFFCNRAGCPIYGGRRLSAARRFLNISGSTAWVLAQPTSERGRLTDFHVSGFVSQTVGLKGD